MKNEKNTKVTSTKNVDKKTDDDYCCGHQMNARFLIGVIIILVGLGLLLQNIFGWFSFNYVWPIVIIIIGIYLIKKPKHNN